MWDAQNAWCVCLAAGEEELDKGDDVAVVEDAVVGEVGGEVASEEEGDEGTDIAVVGDAVVVEVGDALGLGWAVEDSNLHKNHIG